MDFNFVFKWAAKLFFAKVLPGKKTLILAWILKIWGVADLALIYAPQLADSLCTSLNICFQGSVFYGTFLSIVGTLLNVFRWSTKIFPELNKKE